MTCFFDLIQIELIHWLKHFKDKEESLHACFFASPPVETSMFWKLLSNRILISILNWILNFDETILACDQFLQSTISHLCIVTSFCSHKKLQMKKYDSWCTGEKWYLARTGRMSVLFNFYSVPLFYIYTCTLWILSVGKRTNNFLGNDLISKLALSKHLLTRYLVLPLHLCFLLAHL